MTVKQKQFARKIKQRVGCQECGKEGPAKRLHFHHVDRESKVLEISTMARESGYTLNDIKNEINKCKIVCMNCHSNIHSGNYTRDDCIDALEYVTEKLGKSPSYSEYSENRRDTDPSRKILTKIFGCWNNAKEAANLSTNTSTHNIDYTRDECIDALEYVAKKLDKSPTRPDYKEHKRDTDPSCSSIRRRFDSWNNLKEASDLKIIHTEYDGDDCIDGLEYVEEKLGKSPSKKEYSKNKRDTDPSAKTVARIFDSWNDAKEAANLKSYGGYTRDDCISGLEYVAETLDKSPTNREYGEHKRDTDPSHTSIRTCFESWNDAKEAANLSSYGSYTRDDCIDALEYVAETLGKSPSYSEYSENRRDTDPSHTSIRNCFESWNDAKEAADLKTVGQFSSDRATGLDPEPEADSGLVIEGQSELGSF